LRDVQATLSHAALDDEHEEQSLRDARLGRLREKRDDLDLALRRLAGADSQRNRISIVRLCGALQDRAAVVDFFAHRVFVPAHSEDDTGAGLLTLTEPRLSAWITRPDRDRVTHIDLGPVAEIEDAVRVFLDDLVAKRGSAPGVEGDSGHNNTLRALLWDPLVPHLDGIEMVFVSPDGVVGALPFEVLQADDGRFLIEDFAFVTVPDVVTLVGLLDEDETEMSLDSLLSLGGVDYSRRSIESTDAVATASASDLRGSLTLYWGRLPSTDYESQVVFDMHSDAFAESDRRVLLQRADATETRLKLAMPDYAVLHVATHGFFQPEGLPSMWEAALKEANREGPQLSEVGTRLVGMHPGLLSRLVLAGANKEPDDDEDEDVLETVEDGYLTAEELTWFDLSGVELVVLSACETGLGRVASGEGLMGLRRAFMIAGADTVISSLWSVKDESTSELMQSFYKNLFLLRLGRHEALRAAQLDMLQRNRARHGDAMPSTWGAFVLSGEWR